MLRFSLRPTGSSCLHRLLLSLLLLLPALSSVSAAQGDGTPGGDNTGGETEGELNCFEVLFPGSGVRAIVQNYPDMGPAFAAKMRTFAKRTYRQTVLDGENELSSAVRSGIVYGVEFDWFFAGPSPSTTGLATQGPVNVYGTGPNGEDKLFAQVFGYDAGSYSVRKAMVEAMVGHPMVTFVLYAGDLVGVQELSVSGSGNDFFGPLQANAGVSVSGTSNTIHGTLGVTSRPRSVEGNDLGLLVPGNRRALPEPIDTVEALRARAQASGTYVPGNLTITAADLPAGGLVFAEGSITVTANGVVGRWTLVSAVGDVSLRGDRMRLEPALSGALAIAFQGDVSLRGNESFLAGTLSAPNGGLELSGQGNTLVGALSALSLRLSGFQNFLSDGSEVPQP